VLFGALFFGTFAKATPIPTLNSSINISCANLDDDDYANIRVQGCIKGGGSTNGWWYYDNTSFDSNGDIDLDLGYEFSSIEAYIEVYKDGYPDCPWFDYDSDGTCLGTIMVYLDFDLDQVYPWECPEE